MTPLSVARVDRQTADVTCYELQRADGGELPAFEPGAHIDIATPLGPRQYSLSNLCGDGRGYQIGVKREAQGRGGSQWVHAHLRVGAQVSASLPRNNFRLSPAARHHCLVAGGIGITPLLAMARHLWASGASFELTGFSRSASAQPFLRCLQQSPWAHRVRLHFDDEARGAPSFAHLAAEPDTHVYLCGPAAFMDHVRGLLPPLPAGAIHTEHFAAAPMPPAGGDSAMEVVLARTGRTLCVPAGLSILQALRAAGLDPMASCEAGVCGACATPYLAGEPDHRDQCLSPAERARMLTLCCSRAHAGPLVLDL